MIYKVFQDLKLSALGFGAMRLPVVAGKMLILIKMLQAPWWQRRCVRG